MPILDSLKHLFFYMLEYSLYAAAIAVIVIMIRALFAKKLPAVFSYALWIIVLVRLLFPFPLPLPSIIHISDMQVGQDIQTATSSPLVNGQEENIYNFERYPEIDSNPMPQQINSAVQPTNITGEQINNVVFDPAYLFGIVWLAGMLFFIAHTAIMYISTRKKLKYSISIKKGSLIEECANLVGIKFNENIYFSEHFNVPALFGTLRPRIILPLYTQEMSDTELKHIIIHEMIHKKRGDMWIKLVVSIVLFFNWFNPILWIANRLYIRDMERTCDQRVIKIFGMSSSSKKAYAELLLNVALNMNNRKLSYCGIAFAKSNVKSRVKSILFLKRFSRSFTAFSLSLVIVLSIVILTACQPTPEKAAVVGKGDNTLEDLIAATPAPELSTIQPEETKSTSNMVKNEHWTDNISSKNTSINIDADVFMPNVSTYPVLQVTPAVIDESIAKRFVDILSKNADKIYNGSTISMISKEDIQNAMVRIQKEIQDLKDGKLPPDDKRPADEQIKELEDELSELQKQYNELQSDNVPSNVSLDYTFKKDTFPGRNSLIFNVQAKDGSIKILQFNHCEESSVKYSLVTYIGKDKGFGNGQSISQDEAKKLAFDFIDGLEIGQFDLTSESANENYNELVFSKSYDGIPLNLVNPSAGKSGGVTADPVYNFILQQESLDIMLNDTGIISFEWISPCSIINTENTNVTLKSFDEIKELFKQQILYNILETDGEKHVITISDIRLGYMIMPVKGELTKFRTIPVWDFIGYETGQEKFVSSYLTINAIDGSIVDRNVGY